MSDPSVRRPTLFLAAGVCFGLFTVIALLVAADWTPLVDLEAELGASPYQWTLENPLLQDFWRAVGLATGTIPLTLLTLATAVLLLLRNHRRAAFWTLGVMAASSAATYVLKRIFQRDRPNLEDPIVALDSFAFPSGHASGIASAMGVAVVLTLMLVRRRSLRRGLVTLWVLIAVLVGADRIFLGVHSVADVLAGWLLGTGCVLLGLAVYPPTPRSSALTTDRLPEVYPTTRQLAVILNPIKVEDEAAFRQMLTTMAAESGWSEPSWHLTTVEDPGKSMAEAAAVSGADLVLACGGDGTVRTVCAELAGTGVPVGIVPAGTGNLLARSLGIPLYLRAAVDAALNGQDRAIDLVAVSGDGIEDGHFMVMAGMGFDAAIMEGVNEKVKAKVGWIAYVVSGLRSLMFPAVRMEVSIDDGEFSRHRARTVVIGNVGNLQAGIPLIPDAAIDDGQLDVVLLYPRRFLSWIPLAVRVLSKAKRTDETITRMVGRKVVVRASTDTPRQLDGDAIGEGREITAECIHGKLLVRVPR